MKIAGWIVIDKKTGKIIKIPHYPYVDVSGNKPLAFVFDKKTSALACFEGWGEKKIEDVKFKSIEIHIE